MSDEISMTNVAALKAQFVKLIRAPSGWDEDLLNQWEKETELLLCKLGIQIPNELQRDEESDLSEETICAVAVHGNVKMTDFSKPERKDSTVRNNKIENWKQFLFNELSNLAKSSS